MNQTILQALKNNGYKMTKQRKMIIDILNENQDKHLNCQDIYDILKKDHPEYGIATVYRTIAILEKSGIIYSVDFGDGFNRFEIQKPGEIHRHHHLICTKCNKVIELQEDALDNMEQDIYKKMGFTIKDHRLKFYGYCKDCSEKEAILK